MFSVILSFLLTCCPLLFVSLLQSCALYFIFRQANQTRKNTEMYFVLSKPIWLFCWHSKINSFVYSSCNSVVNQTYHCLLTPQNDPIITAKIHFQIL
jgi:hypothetical protein